VSVSAAERRPLVYAATAALSAWSGDRPLETVVAEAIQAGRVEWRRRHGYAFVHLDGCRAVAERRTSPLGTGRASWLVTRLVSEAARDFVNPKKEER
jgi:hypothetical protein